MATTRRFALFSRPAASLLPPYVRAFLSARLWEALGFLLILLALFTFFAVITYAAGDPSLNTVGVDQTPVQNLMGPYGAIVADVLVQTVGVGALVLALWVGTQGWAFMRHFDLQGHFMVRFFAMIVGMLGLSVLCHGVAAPARWGEGASLAGSFGTSAFKAFTVWLPASMAEWRGVLVTGVVVVISLFAVLLAAGLPFASWVAGGSMLLAAIALLGRAAHATWQAIASIFGYSVDELEEEAEEAPQRGTRRSALRKPPVIERGDEAEEDETDEEDDRPALKVAKKKTPAKKPKQGSLGLSSPDGFELPPIELLQEEPEDDDNEDYDERTLTRNAEMLQQVLNDFNIDGEIVKIHPGPVVTLYELEPAPGIKSSRVISLCDDIARSMSALSVRAAVVPGRNVIGIEIPNKKRRTVYMHTLLQSEQYADSKQILPLVLGKDIGGEAVMADLAKMPHLLVAGTTGSGKSVAINTMILSLVYRLTPDKCRFIMIDPKMLELSVYDDIPHLLTPVVTDPGRAVVALKWTVREMEDRYRMMSKMNVRNLDGFNAKIREAQKKGEVLTRRVQTGFDVDTGKPVFEDQPIPLQELPYIVVIVDEFADLMLVAGKDVESAIQRLAQMARAAGIHLIMATQRPSVDVITGVIKANFPTRISFQVTSKIDSRTILGEGGAEQLLGRGDMLYMMAGGRITRVHGPFVSDREVEDVVAHLKAQGEPNYLEDVTEGEIDGDGGDMFGESGGGSGDELYDQAVALVAREQKASTSFIQRHLNIGYNRAAKIIEQMEKQGVVSQANHVGKREVLVGQR